MRGTAEDRFRIITVAWERTLARPDYRRWNSLAHLVAVCADLDNDVGLVDLAIDARREAYVAAQNFSCR